MQIVSDRAFDLSPEQMKDLDIHLVPLYFTLDGKTYASGVDIQPDEFYQLLSSTESFPVTSQPSSGEFESLYRRLADDDPEILSIHISSGLSGTLNAARTGASAVPNAHITFVDTKTLSCPMGWQVEAAARAIRAGWSLERILAFLDRIRETTEGMFTVSTLRYLIHGGRISHLKGLIASILNIKPIIGVEKERGTYVSYGQEVTLNRAITRMVDLVARFHPLGSAIRVQPLHGNNLAGAELLLSKLRQLYDCTCEPNTIISPVLGAHTGSGLVGLAIGAASVFADMP